MMPIIGTISTGNHGNINDRDLLLSFVVTSFWKFVDASYRKLAIFEVSVCKDKVMYLCVEHS